jgi:transcriptional regulator with XRE-family HTH domain
MKLQEELGIVENINLSIGKRIRELRKQKKLSQEELGWKAELHFTYIGGIERGEKNCSINTLSKVARGLEVNIVDLFNYPTVEQDVSQLRDHVKKKINKASPELLKIIMELLKVSETK